MEAQLEAPVTPQTEPDYENPRREKAPDGSVTRDIYYGPKANPETLQYLCKRYPGKVYVTLNERYPGHLAIVVEY